MLEALKQPAVIFAISGGILTILAGIFAAIDNDKTNKESKELAKNNLQLGEENRKLATTNNELILQITDLSTKIATLTEKNYDLSDKINSRIIEESGKSDVQRSISSTTTELDNSASRKIFEPIVKMGGGVIQSFESVIASSDGNDPMNVWVEDNKLMAKITLKDSYGEIFATINGNIVKVFDSKGIDYNYDKKAYEIIRADGRVIFQIELIDDTVYCSGLFCTSGMCIYFDELGMHTIASRKERFPVAGTANKPIFLYPREKYLGKRRQK